MEQRFTPPICLCVGNKQNKIEVALRVWQLETNQMQNNISQDMGYAGQMQIEEVWKHAGFFKGNYSKKVWARVIDKDKPENKPAHIYISNYGYISVFSKEECYLFTGKNGTSIYDLPKDLLKKRNIVPENRLNSGCEICLNVLAERQDSKWDIHRLVAENFLEKPDGKGYWVHHIDNNSYNNNVTNLIYVKGNEHQSKHRDLHPMSRK